MEKRDWRRIKRPHQEQEEPPPEPRPPRYFQIVIIVLLGVLVAVLSACAFSGCSTAPNKPAESEAVQKARYLNLSVDHSRTDFDFRFRQMNAFADCFIQVLALEQQIHPQERNEFRRIEWELLTKWERQARSIFTDFPQEFKRKDTQLYLLAFERMKAQWTQ